MTPEQHKRWEDFAIRAAKTWYATSRRPSAAWVLDTVEEFFDRLDEDDVPCVVNWDNSTEYPEGNPYRRRSGMRCEWEFPSCIGDQMSEFLDDYRGSAPTCRACRIYEDDTKCRCDAIEDFYYEQWDKQWGGPVRCCIRAGLDMACAPSGGVVGFTAGDIRKMYPEGVPEWLFPPNEKLMYALSDVENGTFAELPDDAGMWL